MLTNQEVTLSSGNSMFKTMIAISPEMTQLQIHEAVLRKMKAIIKIQDKIMEDSNKEALLIQRLDDEKEEKD